MHLAATRSLRDRGGELLRAIAGTLCLPPRAANQQPTRGPQLQTPGPSRSSLGLPGVSTASAVARGIAHGRCRGGAWARRARERRPAAGRARAM